MIELLSGLPDNVVAVSATGQVTGEDYENVLIPEVERKLAVHERIRFIYVLGPELKRFTTTAFWDDARVGFHHFSDFERIAVVTDVGWIATMVKAMSKTMPAAVQLFGNADVDAARAWISEA